MLYVDPLDDRAVYFIGPDGRPLRIPNATPAEIAWRRMREAAERRNAFLDRCAAVEAAIMRSRFITKDDCWLLDDCLNKNGYASVYLKGRSMLAHRFMYMRFHRIVISKSHVIDHLCRVRNCCNPAHLEAVTISENVRRGNASRKLEGVTP